jgi:hypothetical protein
MMTAAIPPMISPYSMAVAAESSRLSRMKCLTPIIEGVIALDRQSESSPVPMICRRFSHMWIDNFLTSLARGE